MLMRPSWIRASSAAKAQLITRHYRAGITPSGLAASISTTTGEIVTRQMILSMYRQSARLESRYPLNGVARFHKVGDVSHDDGFSKEEAAAYDAAAPGITVLDVTDKECRWPIRDGLFCGHAADGRYCEHHTARSRGTRL